MKIANQKMVYGVVGEILAILAVSWWQIFYLMSLLEKKIII